MASFKELTIFIFESLWSNNYNQNSGFLPQASILPYLKALSENFGCNIIYRQIRSEGDFKMWANAIKHSNTGKRIIWIAGHGHETKGKVKIKMPAHQNKGSNFLSPGIIKKQLEEKGEIEGIIIDSCMFAKNTPKEWIPNQVKWALAYNESVNWTESVFFGMKTLEWLYHRNDHPKNGESAKKIYETGVKTGGYKEKSNQFSLREFATSLKADFYYQREKSSPTWQTLSAQELTTEP